MILIFCFEAAKQIKNIFRTIVLGKMGASMVKECVLIFS